MSGSGQLTDSPFKVWIWCGGQVVGIFATWSAILNPHWYMPKNFFDASQNYIPKLQNEMGKIPLQ